MAFQKDEPTFFLLKNRLSALESTNLLGRVIQSFQDPMFDYTPESPCSALTTPKFTHFLQPPQYNDNVRLTTQATTSCNGSLEFLSLASLSTSNITATTTTVTSPRITTRRLKHEPDYFNALKASDPHIRRKLFEMCPVNEKAYLVVGTMSASVATFERTAQTEHGRGAGARLPPLEEVAGLAATGMPLLTGNGILNAEAGFERWRQASTSTEFDIIDEGEGEQVFAVACRVVKRNWRGWGRDVQMGLRQPEYNGGQHFGENSKSDSDSDSDSDCEDREASKRGKEYEMALVQGLELGDLVG